MEGVTRYNDISELEEGNLYFMAVYTVTPEISTGVITRSIDEELSKIVKYDIQKTIAKYKPNFGFNGPNSKEDIDIIDIEGKPMKPVEYRTNGDIKSLNTIKVYEGGIQVIDGIPSQTLFIYDPTMTEFKSTRTGKYYPLENVYFYTGSEGSSLDFTRATKIFIDKLDKLELIKKAYPVNYIKDGEFKELIEQTNEAALNFTLDLKPKVTVICEDSSFVFYPPMIPIAYELQKSLFNTSTIDTVTLSDYPSSMVKPLFMIFLGKTLPEPYTLNDDYIELYRDLSDYLGFEFYADYFSKLL